MSEDPPTWECNLSLSAIAAACPGHLLPLYATALLHHVRAIPFHLEKQIAIATETMASIFLSQGVLTSLRTMRGNVFLQYKTRDLLPIASWSRPNRGLIFTFGDG